LTFEIRIAKVASNYFMIKSLSMKKKGILFSFVLGL